MARNGSGTYSLPNSAVVTGTTITATDENGTRNDIATELTDSLSRSNKGAMLAPLSLHDGASAAAPDITWSGDADTGLYHSAANTIDIACGGTKVFECTSTGVSAFTATDTISTAKVGANFNQTTADTPLVLNGNRSAASTGNADVRVSSIATRTAGNLLDVVNNATTKLSVAFDGSVTSSGSVSASNTPKAWGRVHSDGVGGYAIDAGFNVASVAADAGGKGILVTFTTAIGSTSYAVISSMGSGTNAVVNSNTLASGNFILSVYNAATAAQINLAATGHTVNFVVNA